jgi:hypothetical protein
VLTDQMELQQLKYKLLHLKDKIERKKQASLTKILIYFKMFLEFK